MKFFLLGFVSIALIAIVPEVYAADMTLEDAERISEEIITWGGASVAALLFGLGVLVGLNS
jgi:hypothetical protein